MHPRRVDVIIFGVGLVGGVLARALALKGISCLIIDKILLDVQFRPENDGRTTAVNYGSKLFFEELGIWGDMCKEAQPIEHIKVYENGSPWTVNYHAQDIGDHPLGYILINHNLRHGIHKGLEHPLINLIIEPKLTPIIKREPHSVSVALGDQVFEASLLVGAEGRNSPSRSQTDIKCKNWEYGQKMLVVHFTHKKSHNNTAFEMFLPEGPFATLPLTPCPKTHQSRSGLAWALPKNSEITELPDEKLAKTMEEIFPHLGEVNIESRRWVYPLSALEVDKLVDTRFALVGDAAHGYHPVAGQGANVGWRDVAALANLLGEAKRLGLDIGSSTLLNKYSKSRQKDLKTMMLSMEGILYLFGNESKVLHFARNMGFGIVNKLTPLKKILMKRAMGI
jgi:2-octaprenyl-6-methoxyphenol hydroxylase